jgi:hypothetical protein
MRSGKAVDAKGIDTVVFPFQNTFEIQSQQAAGGCEIEYGISQLRLDDVRAVWTELSLDMALDVIGNLGEIYIIWEFLFAGVHTQTPTTGHRFGQGPIDPGRGVLEFGHHIEDAAIAHEILGYRFLKFRAIRFPHINNLPFELLNQL